MCLYTFSQRGRSPRLITHDCYIDRTSNCTASQRRSTSPLLIELSSRFKSTKPDRRQPTTFDSDKQSYTAVSPETNLYNLRLCERMNIQVDLNDEILELTKKTTNKLQNIERKTKNKKS